MSAPPSLPPIEDLGDRPFSFYPPIIHIEHNEWQYRSATWSEILVLNTKSNEELWIPRKYVGEISKVDEPVMIVGLMRELEYKAGMLWPYERRVLEMPRQAGGVTVRTADTPMPQAPGSRRSGSSPESHIGRLVGIALLLGIVACVVVVGVVRSGVMRPKVVFTAKDQNFLDLRRDDGYFEVVRKLGAPAEDRWRPGEGELRFRILAYPDRGYGAVLMGTEQNNAKYIGCVDKNWHVVHAVDGPRGDSTLPLLRNLKPF